MDQDKMDVLPPTPSDLKGIKTVSLEELASKVEASEEKPAEKENKNEEVVQKEPESEEADNVEAKEEDEVLGSAPDTKKTEKIDIPQQMFKPDGGLDAIAKKVQDFYSQYRTQQEEVDRLKKSIADTGVDEKIDMDEFNADPTSYFKKMSDTLKSEVKNYLKLQDEIRNKEEVGKSKLRAAQHEFDNYTKSMFPELNDQTSEMFAETQREYQRIVGLNPAFVDNPDTVYNAASRAYARLAKSGKLGVQAKKSDMIRKAKISQSVVEKPSAPKSKSASSADYTPMQRRVAESMGLDVSIYDDWSGRFK